MPTANPIINGFVPEFAEIEIALKGVVYQGVAAIDYDSDSDGVDVMGTAPESIARTVGTNKHSASMELYLPDATAFLAAFGNDYRRQPFDITVNFGSADGPVTTDVLVSCLIKGISNSHRQGSDALTRKFTLRPFRIKRSNSAGAYAVPVVTDIIDQFV